MVTYKTTQRIALHCGKIGLTRAQANIRSHRLNCVKAPSDSGGPDGVYEVTGPVVFKAGEILGIEDPDKAIQRHVVEIGGGLVTPVEKPEAEPEKVLEADPFADAEKPAEKPKKRRGRPAKKKD